MGCNTLAAIATHYEVLSVDPDASPDRIRAAYRERARLHHPDRGAGSAAGAAMADVDMADVNEAYRVLRHPDRRRAYDHALRNERGSRDGSIVDDDPAGFGDFDHFDGFDGETEQVAMWSSRLMPDGPARVPWKMMLVMAALGSAIVLVAAAFNDPPSTAVPDGILRVGSCVAIEPNGDVREVACTGDGDIVVDLLLPTGATCPGSSGAFRDRLGLGTVCIEQD